MFFPKGIETDSDIFTGIAENIDRLITVDLPFRAVSLKLYQNARSKSDAPLTFLAAKRLLSSIGPERVVLIATGWPDRPHINPEIAETDGPPGAASLGMSLHKAQKIVPVFLIENQLVEAMSFVATAAGFKILSAEEALCATQSRAPLHAASVLGFPTDLIEAEKVSDYLLDSLPVGAIIVIEKGGVNEKGVIHTSRGDDTTTHMAKIDVLVRKASKKGMLTIGVGDGGNEIGMGVIAEELRSWLPYGKKCRCGCGAGIVPVTKTDLLVPAAVSNWGAYGVAAMVALMVGRREIFHSPEIEKRILESCIRAGLIDGGSGYVSGGADALDVSIHMSLVDLLGELVQKGIRLIKNQPHKF
jgi:hypothetical protein